MKVSVKHIGLLYGLSAATCGVGGARVTSRFQAAVSRWWNMLFL